MIELKKKKKSQITLEMKVMSVHQRIFRILLGGAHRKTHLICLFFPLQWKAEIDLCLLEKVSFHRSDRKVFALVACTQTSLMERIGNQMGTNLALQIHANSKFQHLLADENLLDYFIF